MWQRVLSQYRIHAKHQGYQSLQNARITSISSQTQLVRVVETLNIWRKLKSGFISYDVPPRFDITLDDFEKCALDRLRVLAEIESSILRNRSPEEMQRVTETQSNKYFPLNSNTAIAVVNLDDERTRDHVSHFVLRLAFCRSCVTDSTRCMLHKHSIWW
jgi:hypothetical protein